MTDRTEPITTGVSRRNVLRNTALVCGTFVLGGIPLSGRAGAEPGQGAERSGKFRLHGDAEIVDELDVRPTNHVVEIDTSEDGMSGSASRQLGVQASELDGTLAFDYRIVEGDCGGGSPRLVLSIDDDGDGAHDFYLVTDGSGSPGWTSCPAAHSRWVTFDATDDGDTYWRVHPGSGYHTWTDAKAQLSGDHTVLSGALVDDSFWSASAAGVAYYDNVTIGDRTLDGHDDVVGRR